MIELTEEQRLAVEWPDSLGLTSCPGSGKTRTILAKLLSAVDEVRGSLRKIACITFTNAGVDEIDARLRSLGTSDDSRYCEISTIHSFCLNYVLKSHWHLVPNLDSKWSIVTSSDPWCEALIKELVKKYQINPSLADYFDSLQRQFPDGNPSSPVLPLAAVNEFYQRLDGVSKITIGDIVYYSAKIVKENEFIARTLASRFAWFIVDEFQDTTIAQAHMLLEIFRKGRTKIFFVGDPNQAILTFAGGHPDMMNLFGKAIEAKTDISLKGNFRSSKLIVECAERLCPSVPPMIAVGEHRDFHIAPTYTHRSETIDCVFEHFLPALDELKIELGNAAILAPWFTDLLKVGKELRNRQIPIIGPGARPYKRSHEFARISEATSAYLVSHEPDALAALQKALFVTVSQVTEAREWDLFRFNGRRICYRLVRKAQQILDEYESVEDWLLRCAFEFEMILIEEDLLTPSLNGVFVRSSEAMLAEMRKHNVDVSNMSATELGMLEVPGKCLNLMTLHKSKGREFEAVAVILVQEGRIPHFNSQGKQNEIDESQRLLYVAATRAKKLLMLFTDQSHYKNTPSRFLGSKYLNMLGT